MDDDENISNVAECAENLEDAEQFDASDVSRVLSTPVDFVDVENEIPVTVILFAQEGEEEEGEMRTSSK